MGTKYPGVSVSAYNSSPPSDDGSQTASNLVSWATHKTKIGDPLNTAIAAINTAVVAALNTSVRQITTSDSTVLGDHMRTVEIAPTVSSAVTVSLGDAATMTTIYLVAIKNSSTISQTLGRVTVGDTIDGVAANVTIPSKATILLTNNVSASGYLIIGKTGPFIDTDALIVGSSDGTKKVRFEVDGLTTGTTRVITVPDADLTMAVAATQAEQEAASSTTAFASPGRQQFHPSAAKFWCCADASGTAEASYNISSVGDTGTGIATFNFTTAFSSATGYAVVATMQENASALIPMIASRATGNTVVHSRSTASTLTDPFRYHVVGLGDQ